ncbi:Imm7 family immunity protein [Streptomyces sp. NPDC048257]|uniref:Imm7 family immunity protein n=1 Tax=Streptomyces sp. NPDC048257 TaxID=3365526 RepID=UPI00371D8C5D
MFEYHGWITIRESATDDDDPIRLTEIVESLRRYIDEIASPYLLDRASASARSQAFRVAGRPR